MSNPSFSGKKTDVFKINDDVNDDDDHIISCLLTRLIRRSSCLRIGSKSSRCAPARSPRFSHPRHVSCV